VEDILTKFVEGSRKEKGKRVKLSMRKTQGSAGFCVRASGGKKAISALEKALSDIDLSEHQAED
jgi:hypothetical protein